MFRLTLILANLFILNSLYAQKQLKEVTIETAKIQKHDSIHFQEAHVGRKTNIILLQNEGGNKGNNNYRELFNKVPNIFIWESDASQLQTNISTRGLSPNRSWEFNMRQNGVEIASDPYGYPEAYYTPPMDAVDQIQIVRGAGAVLYGSQFGGMVNYILKKPNTKPFSFESNNTIGQYNMLSTSNTVSGTIKRFSYLAQYQNRQSNTFRQNNDYNQHFGYGYMSYRFSEVLKLEANTTYSEYLSHQPGGLTDSMMYADPAQSIRSRNFFQVKWWSPMARLHMHFNKNFHLDFLYNGTIGSRNSVGFTKAINIKDDMSARQVDMDEYHNHNVELVSEIKFKTAQVNHDITAGLKYFNGQTDRFQQGKGTTASDFDLGITGDFGRQFFMKTISYAAYIQDVIQWNALKITPSVRVDIVDNYVSGILNYSQNIPNFMQPQNRVRTIPIFGLSAAYQLDAKNSVYANISNNYRSALFSDFIPSATTDSIASNLTDMTGFSTEIGYKYQSKGIQIEATAFLIKYNDKIGSLNIKNDAGNTILLKTNIGDATHKGLEISTNVQFMDLLSISKKYGAIEWNAAYNYTRATYDRWNTTALVSGNIQAGSLAGNQVEYAPLNTFKTGITYILKDIKANLMMTHTSSVFTDAQNTEKATVNAQAGRLPSYTVFDASLQYTLSKYFQFGLGVNNLFDLTYATRRAGGYPGPGLLPAETRVFYFTFGVKF
jgi:Fe(3+) dicitrate transport protein